MSITRVLPGPAKTRFFELRYVTETGSTNADLLAAGAAGAPEGTVLVADHQTAGRGRQARTWHDEPGNAMLMSVLVRPPVAVATLMPLVAGLAVADGGAELLEPVDDVPGGTAAAPAPTGPGPSPQSPRRLALKWPNDVLVPELAERKLCGILSEASTSGGGLTVVLGMGLNIRWSRTPPPEIAERAATLEELAGRSLDRWDVVAAVLRHLDRWLDLVAADPSAVLDHYRSRCLTLGRRIRMQTPSGVVEGRATGIAESGALILEMADGDTMEVTAGDAHHI